MAVFYNSHTGLWAQYSLGLNPADDASFLGYEALLHEGIGWHEYSSVAAMDAAVSKNKWPTPTTSTPTAAKQGATQAVNAAAGSLGLPTFSNLRDFVVRAMKVVIGAMLIIIGINSLMKDQGIDLPKAVPVPV